MVLQLAVVETECAAVGGAEERVCERDTSVVLATSAQPPHPQLVVDMGCGTLHVHAETVRHVTLLAHCIDVVRLPIGKKGVEGRGG